MRSFALIASSLVLCASCTVPMPGPGNPLLKGYPAPAPTAGPAPAPAAGPAVPGTCSRDDDCPGDMLCDAGRCVGEDGQPAAGTPAPPVAAPAATESGPAAPPTTTMRFLAEDGNPQVIDSLSGQGCVAPCELSVEPGVRPIRIGGVDGDQENVLVPQDGATFNIEESSRGMLTAGVVLTVLSGCTAIAGGTMLGVAPEGGVGFVGLMLLAPGTVSLLVPGIVLMAVSGGSVEPVAASWWAPRVGAAPLPDGGFAGSMSWSF